VTRGGDREPVRPAQARDQGDYRPSTAGAGDAVERRGPGGGRLGPLVRDDGSREQPMVPRAEFQSYYGRQILKTPAWGDKIAYYFFAGGLSGGSALLAAGADLTGRPALRRGARVGGLAALAAGAYFLVADLGRPDRFHHMLRVAKPTSAMSMGTWLLTGYGPAMGLAAASELVPRRWQGTVPGRLVRALGRPAGLAAAALAPGVASYGAVLLSQTAVPAWHTGHEEMPFIFTASSAASAGGLGMIVAPVSEAAPARRLATYGAVVELAASRRLESRVGPVREAYETGDAARYLQRASTLTAAGVLGSLLLGRRSRIAAAASGLALMAGGLFERLGLLHAGIQSTQDPKYVVEPQRRRIAEQGPTRMP
jgi:formate-dependent nitrite reductase membrane component NrfD